MPNCDDFPFSSTIAAHRTGHPLRGVKFDSRDKAEAALRNAAHGNFYALALRARCPRRVVARAARTRRTLASPVQLRTNGGTTTSECSYRIAMLEQGSSWAIEYPDVKHLTCPDIRKRFSIYRREELEGPTRHQTPNFHDTSATRLSDPTMNPRAAAHRSLPFQAPILASLPQQCRPARPTGDDRQGRVVLVTESAGAHAFRHHQNGQGLRGVVLQLRMAAG